MWQLSEIRSDDRLRTVQVPESVFWLWVEAAKRSGTGLDIQIPLPDGPLPVRLLPEELGCLAKLHPDLRTERKYPILER